MKLLRSLYDGHKNRPALTVRCPVEVSSQLNLSLMIHISVYIGGQTPKGRQEFWPSLSGQTRDKFDFATYVYR